MPTDHGGCVGRRARGGPGERQRPGCQGPAAAQPGEMQLLGPVIRPEGLRGKAWYLLRAIPQAEVLGWALGQQWGAAAGL